MITGDKNKNRQRAPAAHRVVNHRKPVVDEFDKNAEAVRKKAPVTLTRIPSLDRPLPPEDPSK